MIAGTPYAEVGFSGTEFMWSPDGSYMLQRSGGTETLIRTKDMTVVRRYSVPNAFTDVSPSSVWIDNGSFFVYSNTDQDSVLTMAAWRGSVSTDGLKPEVVPTYEDSGTRINGLGNGHGAIAFVTQDQTVASCATLECPKFKLWADSGSVGDDMDGWPTAWSLDGTLLAVVLSQPLGGVHETGHVLAAGNYFDSGPLEVLSYPDLQPLYTNTDVSVADIDMRFSPSGRYLAGEFTSDQLLDLQTMSLIKSPIGSTYWYGNDDLIAPDGHDVITQSVDGSIVQRWKTAGTGLLDSSLDGRLAALSDSRSAPTAMTVIRDGLMSRFDLPDLPLMTGVNLVMPTAANDGRSIALDTETPERFGPLLVLQVPD